jgi:hypothetical protein
MNKTIEWILRVAVAGEFIGHGFFALQGRQAWVDWFSIFGISDVSLATQLLFFVGLMDILLAVLILIRPVRLALLWMAIWGFWTALMRPIAGDSIFEFIERSANWAAPLALLLLVGWPKSFREWFR